MGFSFVINKLFLRAYYNFGNQENSEKKEGEIRWSNLPKPLLGGFSFYLLLLFSISVYSILYGNKFINLEIIGVLLSSSCGFLLGWADDGYGTNPILKFVGQFICANLLTGTGLVITVAEITMIDYMFTVFWIIGIMNSINMLDNMDGITGSTSLIICLIALAIAIDLGGTNAITATMLLAVSGALIGFLCFNVSPAKMYMGDTGSQFIGVFLGAISIPLLWSHRELGGGMFQIKQFLIPLFVFAIPIFDTTTVFIRRIARKQSPFVGGRDHTTHHLVYFGFSERQVMYIFMVANAFYGAIALIIYFNYEVLNALSIAGLYIFYIISFFVIQRLYDIGKRRQTITEHRKIIRLKTVRLKNKKA